MLDGMALSREKKFELIGGLFGLAIAYGGVIIGIAVGWVRFGIALLAVTVPAGVVLGWLLANLLAFGARTLEE